MANSQPVNLSSLLEDFGELVKCSKNLMQSSLEFLQFAIKQVECRVEGLQAVNECTRLMSELEKETKKRSELEAKLSHVRRIFDNERRRRAEAEGNVVSLEEEKGIEMSEDKVQDLEKKDDANEEQEPDKEMGEIETGADELDPQVILVNRENEPTEDMTEDQDDKHGEGQEQEIHQHFQESDSLGEPLKKKLKAMKDIEEDTTG
ncbi:hypothetical protein L9F63_016368 [Diploptera punctata]|uniref:Uncharacterized protein n=1 Tax=Diploptera punctata TaxID=6984 RepID=A0AAD8A1E4_DIPPU|nr:hypothetical protein L9F63_016368 [Diploptera punctata]